MSFKARRQTVDLIFGRMRPWVFQA